MTAGFISKWHLIVAAIDVRSWVSVATIVLGSLFSVGYVWRIIEAMYFKPELENNASVQREMPAMMLFVAWLLIGFSFYIGVNPSWLVEICMNIAKGMLS